MGSPGNEAGFDPGTMEHIALLCRQRHRHRYVAMRLARNKKSGRQFAGRLRRQEGRLQTPRFDYHM